MSRQWIHLSINFLIFSDSFFFKYLTFFLIFRIFLMHSWTIKCINLLKLNSHTPTCEYRAIWRYCDISRHCLLLWMSNVCMHTLYWQPFALLQQYEQLWFAWSDLVNEWELAFSLLKLVNYQNAIRTESLVNEGAFHV